MKKMKKNQLKVPALIALTTSVIMFTACQENDSIAPSSSTTTSDLNSNARIAPVVPANLEVPAGNSVCFHAFASGFQIYVVTLTATGCKCVETYTVSCRNL